MYIILYKLKITFTIEFLKKELTSSYTIIISKVFEGDFEYIKVNIKLKILNNRNSSHTTGYIVFNDMKII